MLYAVRLATEADAVAVAALIVALDLHYAPERAPRPEATLARVEAKMLGGCGTEIALAFDGETPVGMAIFAELHPGADLGGVIFLKDLFVIEAARGQGVGEELMRFLAQEAKRRGVNRIDLTTEDWNTGAIGFYQRLGGAPQSQKVLFRFAGEAFERLAGE